MVVEIKKKDRENRNNYTLTEHEGEDFGLVFSVRRQSVLP